MKIVQLITKMDTIGGAQIHVRDISVGMKHRGHTVVLVTGIGENIHSILDTEKIRHYKSEYLIRDMNIISDVKAFIEIRKTLKEIEPDLIATHSSKAGIIGRIAGWTLRIPTVFTAHGWSFTEGVPKKKRILYMFIEKIVGFLSDGIITVSEYDGSLARKNKVVSAQKLHTIHNGVHEFRYPKRVEHLNNDPTIIMVARFARPKKQLALLKALQKLQLLGWHVRFAGDGPLLNEAMDYVKNQRLCERVEFLGDRTDVTKLLQQSDVFVLLSDWEGLPISILEAMRSGLPIIASDVGGVKEAVRQSINGYIIPKNDEEELIRKLTQMLTNSILRLEMGNESRKLFEIHFTFKKMLDETDKYYEKVIDRKTKKLAIPREG